jgi:hypothetical protein
MVSQIPQAGPNRATPGANRTAIPGRARKIASYRPETIGPPSVIAGPNRVSLAIAPSARTRRSHSATFSTPVSGSTRPVGATRTSSTRRYRWQNASSVRSRASSGECPSRWRVCTRYSVESGVNRPGAPGSWNSPNTTAANATAAGQDRNTRAT